MSAGKAKTLSMTFLLVASLLLSSLIPATKRAEAGTNEDKLILTARSRAETPEAGGRLRVFYKNLECTPSQTAIIVCDMWDRHWCQGATRRVADDLLDVTSTPEKLGKATQKDLAAGKLTYPGVFGIEASILEAQRLVNTAVESLDIFGPEAQNLRALAQYVADRNN